MKCKGSYKRSAAVVGDWLMPSRRTLSSLASLSVVHFLCYSIYDICPFPFTLFHFYFYFLMLFLKEQRSSHDLFLWMFNSEVCFLHCFLLLFKTNYYFFPFCDFFLDSHSTKAFVLSLPLSRSRSRFLSLFNVGRSGFLWSVMLSIYFSPSKANLNISH